MKSRNAENRLYQIAAGQGGYFSATQARQAGFCPGNHTYHVRAGNWIREWRGVYRLARIPLQEDAQYSLWGVWSMNRRGDIQGVFSHETALSLFELSDVQPERLHLTLPRSQHRQGSIPPVLQLHHARISPGEWQERAGYRVTRPFRTVFDLIQVMSVSPEFIRQAVEQALGRGVLTRAQYHDLEETPRIGIRLKEIMKGS